MRSIVYRFDDLAAFARAVRNTDQELALPKGAMVEDGEWVLAVFEIGAGGEITRAAAARGLDRGGDDLALAFERRDWDRLLASCKPGEGPPPPRSSTAGGRTRVLLVDDDGDLRSVVSAMLRGLGLDVDAVPSAEEAEERLAAEGAYELLVLDWNLPGMSGVELCRRIRARSMDRRLPVLFLTAHTCAKDMAEAFESGADDYVVKPFRAPELGARIFGLLGRPPRKPGHDGGPSRRR